MTAPAVDAGAPVTASRVLALSPPMGSAVPCCPLMSDGKTLYTCLCSTRGSADLISIDVSAPVTPVVKTVASLPLSAQRTSTYFAAAVLDGTVFWVDAFTNAIERISLADGRRFSSLPVNGEITDATPLLVDGAAMYLLASAVTGAQGSPVQLLKIDRLSGSITSHDTGGNFHVHQFAQDASSIYLVSDLDGSADAGTGVVRSSRVVRLAKTDGALDDVLPAMTINTPDRLHGGFIGVHADLGGAPGLYSLFEEAPSAGGTIVTRLLRIDPAQRMSRPLLERELDLASSSLWLLGVVDGAVLLARTEQATADGGAPAIRGSSVIVLPAGGGAPRIVADFARDYPVLGLQAVAVDADSAYWLNSSGDLLRLARGALQ
jgi:hypothetical protein